MKQWFISKPIFFDNIPDDEGVQDFAVDIMILLLFVPVQVGTCQTALDDILGQTAGEVFRGEIGEIFPERKRINVNLIGSANK
jgi:hypothetical protein